MPPNGHGTHQYYFWVIALNDDSELEAGLNMWQLLERIEPNAVGMNRLVGQYKRDWTSRTESDDSSPIDLTGDIVTVAQEGLVLLVERDLGFFSQNHRACSFRVVVPVQVLGETLLHRSIVIVEPTVLRQREIPDW